MKTNNIIMGVLVAVIAVMGVAFAAFSTTLTIEGTASISSSWDIDYVEGTCTATSKDAGDRESVGTIKVNDAGKVEMTADFATPGDTVTCTVIVTNASEGLSAIRTGWALTSTGAITNPDAYSVNVTAPAAAELVAATEGVDAGTETLTITVTYKESVTAAPAGTAKFTAQATYAQYGV